MRTEPEIKFTRKFISHHEFRSVVKGEEGGGGGGLERFRARDAFDPPFRHEGVKLNHLPQDELPVTTISVE